MVETGINNHFAQEVIMGTFNKSAKYKLALVNNVTNITKNSDFYYPALEPVSKGYDQGGIAIDFLDVSNYDRSRLMATDLEWFGLTCMVAGFIIYDVETNRIVYSKGFPVKDIDNGSLRITVINDILPSAIPTPLNYYTTDVLTNKYDVTFMRNAVNWSKESSCERNKVGIVLVVNGRERASGYNGTVSGDDNCCEKDYYVCSCCAKELETPEEANTHNKYICGTNIEHSENSAVPVIVIEKHGDDDNIIHAEINLLADCAANGIATKGGTIYITLAPCINCANALIQAQISRVVYIDEFNNDKGIKKLLKHHVNVEKFQGTL